MANTRGNILSGGRDVYIGKKQTDTSALATSNYSTTPTNSTSQLICIGSAKEGSIKLNGSPFEETLHDGTAQQTGIELKFEVEGLETSPTTIQYIENFIPYDCQIVLFPVGVAPANGGTAIRIDNVGISVGFNGAFTRKNANTFKLSAQRYADKFSTAVSTITLTS